MTATPFEAQTRASNGEIIQHATVRDAFEAARKDEEIWKVSFDAANGERIRLVRHSPFGAALWEFDSMQDVIERVIANAGQSDDEGV